MTKVTPLHKKALKTTLKTPFHFKSLLNLNFFEKLILKRLLKLNSLHNVNKMGKHQHGFKKEKSTSTLALQLQSSIARALDENNNFIMASLDFSAAFDLVKADLLLERLRLMVLLEDVVGLIETWLRNRVFYVQVNDLNSNCIEMNSGSILDPFRILF